MKIWKQSLISFIFAWFLPPMYLLIFTPYNEYNPIIYHLLENLKILDLKNIFGFFSLVLVNWFFTFTIIFIFSLIWKKSQNK